MDQAGQRRHAESLQERHKRIVFYGVAAQKADLHIASRNSSTFALSTFAGAPKEEVPTLSNWILGPLSAKLNERESGHQDSKVSPDQLKDLSKRVADGTISATAATSVVLPALWEKEDPLTRSSKDAPETDLRCRRNRENRGPGARVKREASRGLPRREGKGVQLPRRPGDEGDQGQGESRAGERNSEAEAGRLTGGNLRLLGRGFPAGQFDVPALVLVVLALIVLISFFFASSRTIWFLISISCA